MPARKETILLLFLGVLLVRCRTVLKTENLNGTVPLLVEKSEGPDCLCDGGKCVVENDTVFCKCPKGFGHYGSTICKECNCSQDSSCKWTSKPYVRKICFCEAGFGDERGKCVDCECGPDSNCTFTDLRFNETKKQCICKPGFIDNNGTCEEECGTEHECSNGQKCVKTSDGTKQVCRQCNCPETFECFINDKGLSDCRCPTKTCLNCDCPDTFECFVKGEGLLDCRCPANHKETKIDNERVCLRCHCPDTLECFINDDGLMDCRCPENHREVKRENGITCLKKCSGHKDCNAFQKCHVLNDGGERVCEACKCPSTFECYINDLGLSDCRCPANHKQVRQGFGGLRCLDCGCPDTFECFIDDEELSDCKCPANHKETKVNNERVCLRCDCPDMLECFINDKGLMDCRCPENHKKVQTENGITCLKKCTGHEDCNAYQRCQASYDGGERVCENCNCPGTFDCFVNDEGLLDCRCPANHKETIVNNERVCLRCPCPYTFECFINDIGLADCRCPSNHKEIQQSYWKRCLKICSGHEDCNANQKCHNSNDREERVCEKCKCQDTFECFINARGLSDCRCPLDHKEIRRNNEKTCLKTCGGNYQCDADQKCLNLNDGGLPVCETCNCDDTFECFINDKGLSDCRCPEYSKEIKRDNRRMCLKKCYEDYHCASDQKCIVSMDGAERVCEKCHCQDSFECFLNSKGLSDCRCPADHTEIKRKNKITCMKKCDVDYECSDNQKCHALTDGRGVCEECICDGDHEICTFQNEKKRCYCKSGFTRKNGVCADPCSPNPCQNDGSCKVNGLTYKCDCYPPYYGNTCEKVIDPCSSNPCQNGGRCLNNGLTFKCDCDPPYFGDVCEIILDPCSSSPCQNGGRCRVNGLTFKCDCNLPYFGNTCEKVADPCSSNPCQNGGRCRVNGLTFKCECDPSYFGYVCEIECNCGANSQSCFYTKDGSKVCKCDYGYIQVNGQCSALCNKDKCLHGKCEIIGNDFQCRCYEGFRGSRCEEEVQVKPNKQSLTLSMLLFISFATFVLLFGMFCFLFGMKKR